MNHSSETEPTSFITLATTTAGTTVLLDDTAVELDDVEHLGTCRARGSAAFGMDLTKVSYLRHGRHQERIYPSKTLIERLAS